MSKTLTLFKFASALLLSLALFSSVASAADLKQVRLQLPSYGLTLMPALVAHDQGFDHEAGMDFAFTQAPGSIGIKAMLAGDVDFSLSVGAAISAAVAHAPVRVLGVHIAKSFYYLYAKKEYPTLKDLEGKSLGVGAIGDSTDISARQALLAAKVDPSTVNFVSMGIENVPASLIAGALDAGVITPPRDILVDRAGKFVNLGFLGDYLLSPNSGFATTKKMIDEQPELVQRVTDVIMRGSKFLTENRQGGMEAMMKHMKMSAEDAAVAWDRYTPYFLSSGVIDEPSQKSIIDDQVAVLKVRGAKPTLADVFDFQFAAHVK